MTRVGSGLEVDLDLVRAAEVATAQALEPLAGRVPDLVCVFVCGDDPDQTSAALLRAAEVTGARTAMGCSAHGVIGAGRAVEVTPAVAVWAAVLPGVHIRSFHLEVLRTQESAAVVGMPARGAEAPGIALLLADPYSFPVDEFVEQSNAALDGLRLAGGLATGLRGPGSTRLLVDGHLHDRGAVGVLLDGAVAAGTVVSQGCRPVGPPMTVTGAQGNVLLSLAGRPALGALQDIVGHLPPEEQALVSRGLHLGIAMDEYSDSYERGDFLIRGVLGVDAEHGAVIVGDVVEVGRTVRFQVRDAESADAELTGLLDTFRTSGAIDPVDGALLFSCTGRGRTLFPSADHDVLAVQQHLQTHGVAGFFAAGEIGPVAGRNHLHGFTASVVAFGSPRSDRA